MLPEEFLKRIEKQHYIDPASLADALLKPGPVSVRVNKAKWPSSEIINKPVPWEQDGFFLDSRPLFTLDPLFHAGVYYPQEASGMFTGEVVRQVTEGLRDIRILDLCGAPGGKSTHLSSLLGNNGVLVANEVIRQRAAVLAENITKWGIGNTVVTQNDPSAFAALEDFFDMIVVDAPCSGEGMFHDLVAREEWSLSNTRLCSERQRRIVMDVWPALKPGGVLVYSTCTFNPAENEENILWMSNITHSESVKIDISPFTEITEIILNGITGYGFYPGKVRGDGFFISALRKKDAPAAGPYKSKNRETRPSSVMLSEASGRMSADPEKIALNENRLFALAAKPDIFRHLSTKLTIIKSGTMIGEIKNHDFVPAHDLAMSVHLRKESFQVHDVTYDDAISFLRLDDLKLTGAKEGRVLICYRGVPLGFANNLIRRVNNGYPQQWRIRMQKRDDFMEIL